MTAEQKAQELMVNFSFLQYDQRKGTKIKGNTSIDLKSAVKQCAIICVEEIMSNILPIGSRNGTERLQEVFWQEVKEKINNV